MTYARDRSLRETLYRASATRAARGDEGDNREAVLKIEKLREKRA